jgi:hypothetical protein
VPLSLLLSPPAECSGRSQRLCQTPTGPTGRPGSDVRDAYGKKGLPGRVQAARARTRGVRPQGT